MKKVQNLTLIALVFLFIIPSVIQLGSNTVATNIELSKDYIESYTHHDQIWIQSNAEFHAQATAESWAGDGSEENPYIITGYYFDCETQPLRIWHTTVHWIFTGNEIFGVGAAIECGTWVEDATNGAITNNEIHNRHAGIAIADIADFTISENYIHDCWGRGVELFGTMNNTIIKNNVIQNIGQSGIYSVGSRDCIVENNTISYCDNNGISLLTTTVNCIVTDNTILNCDSAGILMANVEGGSVTDNTVSEVEDQGIYLSSLENCDITGNIIGEVDGDGMRLANPEFCDVTENEIENCVDDGFLLSTGTNTSIHWNSVTNVSGYAVNLEDNSNSFSVMYNTFIDNGNDCQICDDGTSNIVSHNFYNDWSSPDTDADGFVDSPYTFEGDSATQDEFPLAVAGVVPTTETITTTTTSGNTENQMPIELILIAGVVGAIVVVASVLMLKRR